MNYEVLGYHSCRAQGSKDELKEKVPFLSRPHNQWLGQGYYFWTDSDHWARRWRKDEENVVSEFNISIHRENLLDLVGSVNDQILFANIIKRFSSRFGNKLCVSSVVSWLLEEREKPGSEMIFRYWAIKAKDVAKGTSAVPFVRSRKQTSEARGFEELLLGERHQMCVYPAYKDETVTFRRFVYPKHFMDGK
ncbi:hypothetical protein [Stutzerimonas stutzeri]|uniref:hypothetical protein n=1 Tax=Stutzerimonas TaxID=2901164 RepID=UPI001BAF6B5A|nr:hypothetical protein [Stutzerimonas stutzeri]QUE76222.1 hypothetical protein KCX70_01195 [Stutzerimonas stutzeri]